MGKKISDLVIAKIPTKNISIERYISNVSVQFVAFSNQLSHPVLQELMIRFQSLYEAVGKSEDEIKKSNRFTQSTVCQKVSKRIQKYYTPFLRTFQGLKNMGTVEQVSASNPNLLVKMKELMKKGIVCIDNTSDNLDDILDAIFTSIKDYRNNNLMIPHLGDNAVTAQSLKNFSDMIPLIGKPNLWLSVKSPTSGRNKGK